MTPKEIENYSIQECYDELEELNNPDLPPIQSMYHDIALDVINKRKQRIKQRLYQFDQALNELEELKSDIKRYFELRNKGVQFGSEESVEMYRLRNRLEKVGKEE